MFRQEIGGGRNYDHGGQGKVARREKTINEKKNKIERGRRKYLRIEGVFFFLLNEDVSRTDSKCQ